MPWASYVAVGKLYAAGEVCGSLASDMVLAQMSQWPTALPRTERNAPCAQSDPLAPEHHPWRVRTKSWQPKRNEISSEVTFTLTPRRHLNIRTFLTSHSSLV
jgi:hypothetical protein